MAQYVPVTIRAHRRCVIDLVDVDSQKWMDYARTAAPPAAWLWRREGSRLRQSEKEIASTFDKTLVSTRPELQLLHGVISGNDTKTAFLANGVDTDYFSPDRAYELPPHMAGTAVVFTGAMDYRPNVDAVTYFADAVLPTLRAQVPDVRFLIVGSNPTPEVLKLSSLSGVVITGRVPDVRPYLAHAKAVVVPLRIARGIQNKVLEAMAMGKPVVASHEALVGIDVNADAEVLVASNAEAYVEALCRIVETDIGDTIGRNARRRVIADHQWSVSLERLDTILEGRDPSRPAKDQDCF
jgi:sugar transferase (PEP-CTERM/EpsH1 system associated)